MVANFVDLGHVIVIVKKQMGGKVKPPDSNEISERLLSIGKVLLLRGQKKNYLMKGFFSIYSQFRCIDRTVDFDDGT